MEVRDRKKQSTSESAGVGITTVAAEKVVKLVLGTGWYPEKRGDGDDDDDDGNSAGDQPSREQTPRCFVVEIVVVAAAAASADRTADWTGVR